MSTPTVLLTEAEAHLKLCQECFARPLAGSLGMVNCVTSRCMAWRWAGHRAAPAGTNAQPVGYCGKGGPPA